MTPRARIAGALAVCAVLCAGCQSDGVPLVKIPNILDPEPPVQVHPPLPTPVEHEPETGSLWRGDESRRFLAFENRAKRIGDLVTVVIDESATASNEAKTELDRSSEMDATINSDLPFQSLVSRPIIKVLNILGFSDRRTKDSTGELSIINADTEVGYDGEGKLSRKATFKTKVACLVTGITDSGLLQVRGTRHMTINAETQVIELSGYVRPEDILIDNTIPSSLIASADIHYGGVGVVSEEMRPPWLVRILQKVLPF